MSIGMCMCVGGGGGASHARQPWWRRGGRAAPGRPVRSQPCLDVTYVCMYGSWASGFKTNIRAPCQVVCDVSKPSRTVLRRIWGPHPVSLWLRRGRSASEARLGARDHCWCAECETRAKKGTFVPVGGSHTGIRHGLQRMPNVCISALFGGLRIFGANPPSRFQPGEPL